MIQETSPGYDLLMIFKHSSAESTTNFNPSMFNLSHTPWAYPMAIRLRSTPRKLHSVVFISDDGQLTLSFAKPRRLTPKPQPTSTTKGLVGLSNIADQSYKLLLPTSVEGCVGTSKLESK